ncbi:hypothetical protein BC835DRAFT_1410814 [Cytidiella melzeri]|nr:hypothetical protein BC835DRAFT_1410814 [Cytidiella melzeri]
MDMDGSIVGPVSPIDFINKLMPISGEHLMKRAPDDVEFDEIPLSWSEMDLCKDFVDRIKGFGISPTYPIFFSADPTDKGVDRPDAVLMEYQDGISANNRRDVCSFDWFHSGLVIEFKRHMEMDPFDTTAQISKAAARSTGADKGKLESLLKLADDSIETFAQLAFYAQEVFSHQHRLHLFQLLICGVTARFLFWDHSGVIVSDRFDYTEQPSLLALYLWRYNHMSAAVRGLDSTARRATPNEAKVFKEAVEEFLENMDNIDHPRRNLLNGAETLSAQYPVYKITVDDDIANKSMNILIQRPLCRSHSPIGPSTRVYLAYAIHERELLLFKDTALCGGDVKLNGERGLTRCLAWAEKMTELPVGFSPDMLELQHHRLLQKLAYPAWLVKNFKDFISAMRDSVKGMNLVRQNCGVVLGNISPGNVMLSAGAAAEGILVDWDLAMNEELSEGQVHQRFHTVRHGKFRSIAMLADPLKAHEALDDFESVFWAVLYGVMHRFDHTNNATILVDMFDEKYPIALPNGAIAYIGGRAKRFALDTLDTGLRFTSLPCKL